MRVHFFGGAREVGRSAIFLEEKGKGVLLDCGIKLGERTEYPSLPEQTFSVIVSHAHLDHCGFLPHLAAKNLLKKVYSTKPTRDLMGVLLADYYRILKLKHSSPPFSLKDINSVLSLTETYDYRTVFSSPLPTLFYNAGHIMGSAMVKVRNVLYSGDICMRKTRVLDPCEKNIEAKTLIVESTYGKEEDRIPSFKESYREMVSIINSVLDRGGFVLIPCFAVGRAQEILLALDDYMRSGALRKSKIFVDGMIWKALRIYRHNAYYANEDIKKRILMSDDDPFKSKNFVRPRSKSRRDVVKEPAIIVTTSGMLSGGPVLSYLEMLAHDKNSVLLFVGYQAEGTLGRKILDGERKFMVNDKEISLEMEVKQVRISGHADFNELLQFIKSVKGLEKIFLVHGEDSDLPKYLEDYEVIVPKVGESYEI